MRKITIGGLLALGAWVAGCGGSSMSGGGSSGCPNSAGVTITSAGFSSRSVCIIAPGSVTFTNEDTVSHDVESASSTSCSQLNLGSIASMASKTASFSVPTSCGFVDPAHAGSAAFNGVVSVGSPGQPGY